jgi:hypothetical protein
LCVLWRLNMQHTGPSAGSTLIFIYKN